MSLNVYKFRIGSTGKNINFHTGTFFHFKYTETKPVETGIYVMIDSITLMKK